MKGVTAMANHFMTDGDIIVLLFARREDGLEQVAKRYGRDCHRIARNILRNEQDAEECVNDTYVKVWGAIPPARPKSLRSFVMTIARNLALDRLRTGHAERRIPSDVCIPLSELEEHLEGIAVSDERMTEDLRRIINEFLDSLSKKDAALFVRRYWYLDSVRRLSEISGYSENNVYQRLFVMRQKLRDRLIKEGYEYEV
jgi:RNA polymerase sigma-70 factor (ECF subfamily)